MWNVQRCHLQASGTWASLPSPCIWQRCSYHDAQLPWLASTHCSIVVTSCIDWFLYLTFLSLPVTICTTMYTCVLHGAESSLRRKLVLQLIKKFPAFYGTRKFITVLTSARHLSLYLANAIQSPQPLPTSSRAILILSSHLRLGLPNSLFPTGFPTKTLCTPLPSSIRVGYVTLCQICEVNARRTFSLTDLTVLERHWGWTAVLNYCTLYKGACIRP